MCNIYPKLRDAVLTFLGCDATREAVVTEIARWDAVALETAMTAQGIPVAVVRDSEEWLRTEQGAALASSPLIHIKRLGEGAPIPLTTANRPFEGVKVVDMTHVLAGPMITRGLAEYGAEVLHLRSADPDLDDQKTVSTEFRLGKSTATLELNRPDDLEALKELLRNADVFVHSWRPGVFEKHGFDPETLAALNPNLIQVAVSCYGAIGPWSHRGGFDGLALASIGATAIEAGSGKPTALPPPGVVTDALVGFLGTGVVASLLQRRANEGGGYRADLCLARVGMWMLGLGLDDPDPTLPTDLGDPLMRQLKTPRGLVDHVAPAVSFAHVRNQLPYAGEMSRPGWR